MDPNKRSYPSVDPKYAHLVMREYRHWTLQVSDNQNYLGRMVIWLSREGQMQRFSGLLRDELIELQAICIDAEVALERAWRPDHINYSMLGNLVHLHGGHAHMHLVPRYCTARVFRGREFRDEHWGRHYRHAADFLPSRAEVLAIADEIIGYLP